MDGSGVADVEAGCADDVLICDCRICKHTVLEAERLVGAGKLDGSSVYFKRLDDLMRQGGEMGSRG